MSDLPIRRIVYISPDDDKPTGGIKVIYRHVELLCDAQIDACVMHFQEGFRCSWFENTAPVIHLHQLRMDDLVIVPEIMAGWTSQLHAIGLRYAMFVQNGYLLLPAAGYDVVADCFAHATAVLSISHDTSQLMAAMFPTVIDKIISVQFSVDINHLPPGLKRQLVTYMPRKQPLHARNVVPWLEKEFPDWEFLALDGMSAQEVASHLQNSLVFLAFSDLEGGPLPPLEAAIAGNVVLGYPGFGGEIYWQEPIFRRVNFADIRDFVRKFHEVANFAQRATTSALLTPARMELSERYSPMRERELLLAAMMRLMHPGE